ncbi:MAG: shikimate kinase [Veillonellaceae bacterium]|nr:shikimate kinase [Veillonellaceae bacterium]
MKNVVLIGFMGTGKSSIGRLLACRLRRPFMDTDKKIEREYGMTIPEIFQQFGEVGFRSRESAVVAKLSRYTNAVISTGGGIVLSADNIRRLRANGVIIALSASPQTILERTSRRNNRPLLNQPDREQTIIKLLNERAPLYAVSDFSIDTTNYTPHQVVDRIISFLREGGFLRG